MEQNQSQLEGWRLFRFGVVNPEGFADCEMNEHPIHQESLGEWCFVTQVDFDQLDQQ